MQKRPKIMIVCSSGGHLFQLFVLKEWWSQYERVWITFKKPDAESLLHGEKMIFAYFPTNRNFLNLFKNAFLAIQTLWKERPDFIVSTGAGVALPFFFFGRLIGANLIFLEVFDRLDNGTLTGKLIYPFCHKFLVQWEEQKAFFPKAEIWGKTL